MEPTVYFQLGISEERYSGVVSKEIIRILKTNETVGNMMLMVQSNTKLTNDEKYYAAFEVSRKYQMGKLMSAIVCDW
jgi:hypothetical protein